MRGISLLFCSILPTFGQFNAMTTTDDGSHLYFSSTLQLTGSTDENSYEKIFVYDGATFRLFAQATKFEDGSNPPVTTNPYRLTAPYVSGNGQITGFVGVADCAPTVSCSPVSREVPSQTTIQFASYARTILTHACEVSRNTQFALCITGRAADGQPPLTLVNLVTGATGPSGRGCSTHLSHLLTSDGRAIAWQFNRVTLFGGGSPQDIPGNFSECAMISDDGSRVIAGGNFVTVADVTAATVTTLNVGGTLQSVSNNGGLALVLAGNLQSKIPQAVLIRTDGSGSTQLTQDPSGIASATLSGDGTIAYAVTNGGKLLRIDALSGLVTQLVGPSPVVQQMHGGATAGSLNTIRGAALSANQATASTFPLPASLGGAQVIINGTAVPILSVSPSSITFQIPWETPVGATQIEVTHPASIFEQPPTALQVQTQQPVSELTQAINQDFSALNDPSHPAMPGEIVNFYLSGLGAVSVQVADGTISPSAPLPVLLNPVSATTSYSPPDPVDVVYAGLAPGLIGIYQVSLRTPTTVNANPLLPNGGPVAVGFTLQYSGGSLELPAAWMIPNRPAVN